MNPALRACGHFVSAPSFRIERGQVLDHYDGPVLAAASCRLCTGMALLDLLDWSPDLRHRVFAVSACDPEALALLHRNLARGSCDASRARAEVEAFVASAGPVESILAYDVREGSVLASAAAPAGTPQPSGALEERLPDPSDRSWFDRLGLDKSAAHETR